MLPPSPPRPKFLSVSLYNEQFYLRVIDESAWLINQAQAMWGLAATGFQNATPLSNLLWF